MSSGRSRGSWVVGVGCEAGPVVGGRGCGRGDVYADCMRIRWGEQRKVGRAPHPGDTGKFKQDRCVTPAVPEGSMGCSLSPGSAWAS